MSICDRFAGGQIHRDGKIKDLSRDAVYAEYAEKEVPRSPCSLCLWEKSVFRLVRGSLLPDNDLHVIAVGAIGGDG